MTDKAYVRFIVNMLNTSFIPPAREVKPKVGLMPANLLLLEGSVKFPYVSVPNVTVASPIDVATPDPVGDPLGSTLT